MCSVAIYYAQLPSMHDQYTRPARAQAQHRRLGMAAQGNDTVPRIPCRAHCSGWWLAEPFNCAAPSVVAPGVGRAHCTRRRRRPPEAMCCLDARA
jgi:hypothetical protein